MFVAIDLGATSGRVITAQVVDGAVHVEVVHRFPNGPVEKANGLFWDANGLYEEIIRGLNLINTEQEFVRSIAIDSWAVDYGLLANGQLLGQPHHYRDTRSERGVQAVHQKTPFEELYAANGLQFLPFNTLYQLAAEDWGDAAGRAENFLLIPDLMGFWLTGEMVTEVTNASTTGLVVAGSDSWSDSLISLTGAPRKIFRTLIYPGQPIGLVTDKKAETLRGVPLVATASHDTASAVVATPLRNRNCVYISLGTWGLVGLELERPILSDAARLENFTNETGANGTVRFLKNVMGLWIINECVAHWRMSYPELVLENLLKRVAGMSKPRYLVDVDDPVFAPPGDMPRRVADWLRDRHGEAPDSPVELLNILLSSLASAYAATVRIAGELADIDIEEINIVGGGSQNHILCQRVADAANLPVIAGPAEATALGNVLIQAATAEILPAGSEAMRHVVRKSVTLEQFEPGRLSV